MTSLEKLARFGGVDVETLRRTADRYPFRLNDYYAGLIREPFDPVWRQAVPDPRELETTPSGLEDPLAEEVLSPVPNLVHRYPNRVLWLIGHECAVLCRFCTRKRRWTSPRPLTEEDFREGLRYISAHPEIRDVLLSGGDPLLLPPERLEAVLAALRKIPHVGIIRIGTRIPCTLPHRVTPETATMIARYHPVYMNLHFNHPWELTLEAGRACGLLADAGIPLGSQTVLLKDVNDRADVLGELFQKLLTFRVRPYYLMQMDLTGGTEHFRTPVTAALDILAHLRNRISGLAMPHFVIDLPGGRGKIPLLPDSVSEISGDRMIVKNYLGESCEYPLLPGEGDELRRRMKNIP